LSKPEIVITTRTMSRWCRSRGLGTARAAGLAGLLLCGQATGQTTQLPTDPTAQLDQALLRARTRERLLLDRSENAQTRARAQALIAYRLLRRRDATFLVDPRGRAVQARSLGSVLLVLNREAGEAALWRAELGRSARDRQALEQKGLPRHGTSLDRDLLPAAPPPRPALVWPVRGTVVGAPGLRRDDASSALVRQQGIRILSRLNQPALAAASGRVHRVAALPQGGFALVVAHPVAEGATRPDGSPDGAGGVSILSGLREVEVTEGSPVERGQRVGLVGRGLDGAPVVTFEFWQRGAALDPRTLFGPDLAGRGRPRALGQ
jgi:murein DD-endopeptidase MepM/ murein hydrolase activator NlpD